MRPEEPSPHSTKVPHVLRASWSGKIPAIIVVLALAGCAPASPEPTHQSVQPRVAPRLKPNGPGERLIIDRYTNKFVLYDLDAQAIVGVDGRPQTFVYAFASGESDLVTVGSSDRGDFSIGRVGASGYEPVLDLPHSAAFPLAVGEYTYFTVNSYAQDGTIATRAVAYLSDGKLVEMPQLTGAVTGGAAVNGELWYTTYEEASDSFTLRSVTEKDPDAQPRERRTGLASGTLFAYDGKVVTEGHFAKGINADCDIYCTLDSANDRLYALKVAGDSLSLDALSLVSGEVQQIVTGDVLDLMIGPTTTTVLLRDRVVSFDTKDLP